MTLGCNTWMICLKLNRFFYGLSRMLQFFQFVWILRSSVLVVFNNFLLIDATDRSKIRSDQKRFFRIKPLPPLIFSRTLPLNMFPIPNKSGPKSLWFQGLTLSSKSLWEFCQLLLINKANFKCFIVHVKG